MKRGQELMREAKGRDCTIRIPGVCSHDPATVVMCHLGGGGMGYKRHSILAAFGCHRCHDVVDGRVPCDYPAETIQRWFHEAIFRTQEILIDEGKIRVGG